MAVRRKNGSGTVRLRKDGRWEGRIVCSYDEKGKAKYKSVFGKTQAECKAKLKELIQNTTSVQGRPTAHIKPTMTFGEWLDTWYQYYSKPAIKETTQSSYENTIYNHIIPAIGNIMLKDLTQQDLSQFYTREKQHGRKAGVEKHGEGVSNVVIRNCHIICNSALKKAVSEKLLSQNPAKGIKTPPKKAKEMQILTPEEIQRFLIQANYDGYYELFLLEFATGLRRGEILGLQRDDLIIEQNKLQIKRQVSPSKGGKTVTTLKTDNSVRIVEIPQILVNVLSEYMSSHDSVWMFPSPVKTDQPLNPHTIYRKSQQILARAGCKKVRFHDLRHTFASLSLENGMEIKTLSNIMGHKTVATTIDTYAHITDRMIDKAANRIDQKIAREIALVGDDVFAQVARLEVEEIAPKEFRPKEGKIRKSGTGGLYQISENLWEGKYSPTNADGKRVRYTVYAKTKEECEIKLQQMIVEKKAEIASEKSKRANC